MSNRPCKVPAGFTRQLTGTVNLKRIQLFNPRIKQKSNKTPQSRYQTHFQPLLSEGNGQCSRPKASKGWCQPSDVLPSVEATGCAVCHFMSKVDISMPDSQSNISILQIYAKILDFYF
jgi:hypothetical protein